MADLKSIANMQIGGPKYPKKRRINLYQKQTKKGKIAAELGAFCRFYGFCLRIFEIWRNASLAGGRPAEAVYAATEKEFIHWRNPTRCTVRFWQSTRIMEMGI